MTIRRPLVVSILLIAVMLALSLWTWGRIPASALIVVHWGIDGKPNGFAHRTFALFFGPATAIAVTALAAFLPIIEPRRLNLAASAKFYRVTWIGTLLILSIAQAVVVLGALGYSPDVGKIVMASFAAFLIAMGNYLGKTRANFFLGIRTPWTLSSDYSWERTHRLTGRLFMMLGAVTLILVLAADARIATYVCLSLLVVLLLAAIVMSYVYWKRDPHHHASDMTPE